MPADDPQTNESPAISPAAAARKRLGKPDWFLIGMAAAAGLAWLFPGPGAKGGFLHPELLTKAGVALIFFLNGLGLSFAALQAGLLRWKVHIAVQSSTFLLFPLVGFGLAALAARWASPELALGFFYLCALPSTVSSSVALTAAARGNVPAAVFNAGASNLLAVGLTPLWVGLYLGRAGQGGADVAAASAPGGEVVLDLIKWLVLPLVVGQLCRPWLGAWAARNKRFTQRIDRGTILLLVYTSFCDSVKEGVWTGQGAGVLILTLVGSAVLFAAVFAFVNVLSRVFGLTSADRIAAVFCGSKKSLASGVPMARLIFGANPALSLILLPIMIYHPLQLVLCSALAARWAKRPDADAEAAAAREPAADPAQPTDPADPA